MPRREDQTQRTAIQASQQEAAQPEGLPGNLPFSRSLRFPGSLFLSRSLLLLHGQGLGIRLPHCLVELFPQSSALKEAGILVY